MDDYVSAADNGCRIRIIGITTLIVVNNIASDPIPDLDSHAIASIAAEGVAIVTGDS
jgi:hypothetical protein